MTLGRSVGQRYRVFSPRGLAGGKLVTVFTQDFGDDLQALAAASGTPLSVFVVAQEGGSVRLRVFTPQRERGESDSGSLAALAALSNAGKLTDWAEVGSVGADETTAAQYCGGEWLLSQGAPRVSDLALAPAVRSLLGELGLEPQAAQLVQTERPNLLLELPDLSCLQALNPDAERLSELGRLTGTTGLVLYTRAAPNTPALRRADLSLRAFGPLRGFLEDAASSNMAACLVAGLGARGLWPQDSSVLRLAQLAPTQPALLTTQFSAVGDTVWVGGRAEVQ